MSEGFAAHFLEKNRYTDIVPQAPLGGPDGGRDITFRDGNRFGVAACYFPPTPHPVKDIAAKFASDFDKAQRFQPQIFLFITGQELTPTEEESLRRHSSSCEIRVLDVHALSIHLVPIFKSLGIDVTEFKGADTSVKLLREVIASSYFWNLPNGWENAIHSFGPEVMSIEALEEVIATVDYDLSDRHLDELLAIFVQTWRNLLCKLMEAYSMKADGSGVSLEALDMPWRAQYEEQVLHKLQGFKSAYFALKQYIVNEYADLLYSPDLNRSNRGGYW